MGIVERRERQAGELKAKIVDTAAAIIEEEGYENLSIRRIAEIIEYSPAIIYHYFKDKTQIIESVLDDGQQKISKCLEEAKIYADDPVRTLYEAFSAYTDVVLGNPNLFRIALFGEGGINQENYAILREGVYKKRKNIGKLYDCVRNYCESGKFRSMDPEIATQIIWTSVYGLVSRFVLEPEVSPGRKKKLLKNTIEILILGLKQ
jgi:AcrR family transcriptional regulator